MRDYNEFQGLPEKLKIRRRVIRVHMLKFTQLTAQGRIHVAQDTRPDIAPRISATIRWVDRWTPRAMFLEELGERIKGENPGASPGENR